jgi:hypothetical protein
VASADRGGYTVPVERRLGVADFLSLWLRRALAFSALFSLVLLLLYGLGNSQSFLDRTQLLLIDMVSVSLWAACLFAGAVLVLLVITGIQSRRFAWLRFLATLAALAICGLLVGVLQFLTAWIRG